MVGNEDDSLPFSQPLKRCRPFTSGHVDRSTVPSTVTVTTWIDDHCSRPPVEDNERAKKERKDQRKSFGACILDS